MAAQLVREADAVERQDLEAAVALWDPRGVIKDDQFAPGSPTDRVWTGLEGIRQRYIGEFQQRRYRTLRHQALVITFVAPDKAVVVNDLDAVFDADNQSQHVHLTKTDRWTLIRDHGRWRITMLEINRAAAAPVIRDAVLRASVRQ